MASVTRFVGIKGLRFVKQSQKVYRVNGLTLVLHRTLSSQSPAIPFCKQIFKTSESDNTKRHISTTVPLQNKTVQFKLSDIGEGIREVVLVEWFVKEGEKVSQFQNICEVQSDKASVTITSRFDGTITKLYHQVDATALVGEALVDIQLDEGSEGADDEITTKLSSGDGDESDSDSSSDEEENRTDSKFLATPAVRNLASQKGVHLKDVVGSGKKGRILKDDIFKHLNDLALPKPVLQPLAQSVAAAATPTTTLPPLVPHHLSLPPDTGLEPPQDHTEAITGIKKAMVKSMTAANHIPHFCFCDQVDLSSMVASKEQFKEVASKYGIKFSYTSIFIKAASLALNSFPLLNSSVDEECKNITYKGSHNIGVAIDSPQGLMVPNIKNVASLSVLEVAIELERLNKLASANKLGLADLSGGTFTLSNIGMIGGTYTKPLIFVPELVIGALGSITKTPVYDSTGQVVPAHLMTVSWSADHRVVDGATLARFSNLWKSFLQHPTTLLLHLR